MLKSDTAASKIQLINKIPRKTIEKRTKQDQVVNFQHPPKQREWNVRATNFALNTVNPIREIVDNLNVQPNAEKSFIPLSVGKRFQNLFRFRHFSAHLYNKNTCECSRIDFFQLVRSKFISNDKRNTFLQHVLLIFFKILQRVRQRIFFFEKNLNVRRN